MRTLTRALPLLLLGAVAWGDDAPATKHDLAVPDRWDAGETVTVHEKKTQAIAVVPKADDGRKVSAQQTLTCDDTTIVRRCTEATPDGQLRGSLVFVKSWMRQVGPVEDRSLEGAIVETSSAGWVLLTPATRPTPAARAWLETSFGRSPQAVRSSLADLAPPGPLAVGEGWDLPPGSLARLMQTTMDVPVPYGDVKARITLDSAASTPDGASVRTSLAIDAPMEGDAEMGGARFRISKGSSVRASGRMEGVPARWHRASATSIKADLKMLMTFPGGTADAAGTIEVLTTAVAGGDLPPVPERPALAGPRFRIASRGPWKAGDTVSDTASTAVTLSDAPYDAPRTDAPTATKSVLTSWSDVRHCEEATAAGFPSRFTVWIREWKHTEGGVADESLRGAVVEVGEGGWRLQTPETKPSPAGKAWLDRTCASAAAVAADDPMRASLVPLCAMGEGEAWEPDLVGATLALRGWLGIPADPGRAKATAKLEHAEGRPGAARLTVSYTFEVPVAMAPPRDGQPSATAKSGTLAVHGTSSGADTDWARGGELSDETTAEVPVPGKDGVVRRISITQIRKRSRVAGGEVPK